MFVNRRMSHPAVTIDAACDYKAALGRMHDFGVRHLPVVNEHGELMGMLNEPELVAAGTTYLRCSVPVKDIMQRDVLTVAPEKPLSHAALRMLNHDVRALPVVDSGSKVVGVITASDIFRALIEATAEEPNPEYDTVSEV